MKDDEDLSLGYVLGTLDEAEQEGARARLSEDQALAAAVTRSEEDMRALRRGLELVASGALSRDASGRRRRWYVPVAAVAVLFAAIVGGLIVASREDGAPVAGGTQPPTSIGAPGPSLTLEQIVDASSVIVVGTVTEIRTGTLGSPEEGSMEYAMATIRVEERIKGAPGESVVAFDYVYGVSSEGGPGGVWAGTGDRLLVFLVSDAGAISEDLEPDHLQIAEGARGRYRVVDGELVDAPYTLQDVRDAATRS